MPKEPLGSTQVRRRSAPAAASDGPTAPGAAGGSRLEAGAGVGLAATGFSGILPPGEQAARVRARRSGRGPGGRMGERVAPQPGGREPGAQTAENSRGPPELEFLGPKLQSIAPKLQLVLTKL